MLYSTSDALNSPRQRPLRRSTRSSSSSTATLPSPALLPLKATKRSLASTLDVKLEAAEEADPAPAIDEPKKKRPRSRRRQKGDYSDLGDDPLTDRIREGLLCLACGENPGVRTAELQLHYASPANHFYKCLHAAGLTPSVLEPTASRTIHLDHNLGITNLVARPTKEASELTAQELDAAVPVFLRKVATYKPKVVFFVGMKVADVVLRYFTQLRPPSSSSSSPSSSTSTTACPSTSDTSNAKGKGRAKKPPPVKAQIGWQPFALVHDGAAAGKTEDDEGGEVEKTFFYCLPSTSGRVAAYPLPVKLKIWATFGAEVAKLRAGGGAEQLNLPEEMKYFEVQELRLPEVEVKWEEVVKQEEKAETSEVEAAFVDVKIEMEEEVKEEE